ncbi:MAG TPA: hypothetical protein PKY25_00115 [Bacilli bacterium]|nr:hypothetical protein [Bacilli bacterium]
MLILASVIGVYFRELLYMIDFAVYALVGGIYNLFIDITKVRIDNDIIKGFVNSMYAIIAIYSLFIMAKMLINIILNPDDFSDKKKGTGAIFTRLVIAIFLVVLIPFIFQNAFLIQDKLLATDSDNPGILVELFLGDQQQIDSTADPGEEIKNLVISALIKPEEKYGEIIYSNYLDKNNNNEFDEGDIPLVDPNQDSTGTKPKLMTILLYKAAGNCAEDDKCIEIINKYNDFLAGSAVGTKNASILLQPILTTRVKDDVTGEKEFVLSYSYFVVTICGAFIAYILLSFSIDVAVRVFKLGVLQITAPLFVATYVDPKSAESGPFSKWQKETISTYIQVFIRVILMVFLIIFVRLIGDSGGEFFKMMEQGKANILLVQLALMIGLLIFIKKAPKMIEDLLGIKSDSKLGIMEKLGGAALIGGTAKAMGERIKKTRTGIKNSAIGGVKRGIGSGLSGYQAARGVGADRSKSFRQGLGGFAKGVRVGGTEGYKAENTRGYYTKGRKDTNSKYRTTGEKLSGALKDLALGPESLFWDAELEKDAKKAKKRASLLLPELFTVDEYGNKHVAPTTDQEFIRARQDKDPSKKPTTVKFEEIDPITGKKIPKMVPQMVFDEKTKTMIPQMELDPVTRTMKPKMVQKEEYVLTANDVSATKKSVEFVEATPEVKHTVLGKMLEVRKTAVDAAIVATDDNREIDSRLATVIKNISDETGRHGAVIAKVQEAKAEATRTYTQLGLAQGETARTNLEIERLQTREKDLEEQKTKLEAEQKQAHQIEITASDPEQKAKAQQRREQAEARISDIEKSILSVVEQVSGAKAEHTKAQSAEVSALQAHELAQKAIEEAEAEEKAAGVSAEALEALEEQRRDLERRKVSNAAVIEKGVKSADTIDGEAFDPSNLEHRTRISQIFSKDQEEIDKLKPQESK